MAFYSLHFSNKSNIFVSKDYSNIIVNINTNLNN